MIGNLDFQIAAMNKTVMPDVREVLDATHYRPSVSIIVPFEPKMSSKTVIMHSLKVATDKVERDLLENYPNELAFLVMEKLRRIILNLNFNTHKKSLAIYVSPVFEKVLYLDIAVEEKIIVDESFEIRDLVFSKKQLHKYLVLLLDAKESRIYLGNTTTFVRIASNTPEIAYAYVNEVPERVSNFSDVQHRREVIMNKFLHHIDNGLDLMLNAYQLPLFVIGPARLIGHFKNLTKHNGAVIDYIEGDYNEASFQELKKVLEPHIADWKMVKQKEIMNLLEQAMSKRKLAIGINDVWHEATHKKGKLLIVEKNYMYAAEHAGSEDVIYKATEPYNKFSYIKDAVDDVIEKVLENGGDVEFVDEGVLGNYDHIALIQYY